MAGELTGERASRVGHRCTEAAKGVPGSRGHHGDCQGKTSGQNLSWAGQGLKDPMFGFSPQLTDALQFLSTEGQGKCSLLRPLLQAPSHTGLGNKSHFCDTGCDLAESCSGEGVLQDTSSKDLSGHSSVEALWSEIPPKRPKSLVLGYGRGRASL